MKKTLLLLATFLSLTIYSVAQQLPHTQTLTANDAYRAVYNKYPDIERGDIYYSLDIAQMQMGGQTYDRWVFFVDEEPQKGWHHNCSLYAVPKVVPSNYDLDDIPVEYERRSMPPSQYDFMPYNIRNSLRDNASLQIRVPNYQEVNGGDSIINEAAEHTYAMIISGGYNKYSNYGRYWNDCSFIYQTLRNKYRIPKNNITLLIADGNDPADDMVKTDWTGYQSSPLDLDFDSLADLHLAATRTNVFNVLSSYAQSLTSEDHLFIYVIDHGSYDNAGNSMICLWNQQYLKDYELAAKLDSINARSINVLLGQCYSGGFVEELEANGRVVATACSGTEPSWACPDIPYDEFVYQWTCAVNEMDKDSVELLSDIDLNGRVTIQEAFEWARDHDRRNETPQFSSIPLSVGEDLAFNNIPNGYDLYIKDNKEDTGKEPNTTKDNIFCSPDIYVRNQNDGFDVHESEKIDTTRNHQLFIYAIVRNRGTEDYTGNDQYVHFYWAAPGLYFDMVRFHNNLDDECAAHIGHTRIGRVNAGDSIIVYSPFYIPEFYYDDYYKYLKHGQLSLVAFINERRNPSYSDLEGIIAGGKQWVRNNNNLAVRNYNEINWRRRYDFEFTRVPDSLICTVEFRKDSVYSFDNIYLKAELLNDTVQGHHTPHLINIVRPNNYEGWLRLGDNNCMAENILITPESNTDFAIKIENEEISIDSIPDYDMEVYLRDYETNEIIGGMTLHVTHREDDDEPETQQIIASNPVIDKVSIGENSVVHVELLKPLEEDAIALVKVGDDTSTIKRVPIRKGTKCFDAKVINNNNNLVFVSIEKNGRIVDSKKTFFIR